MLNSFSSFDDAIQFANSIAREGIRIIVRKDGELFSVQETISNGFDIKMDINQKHKH